MRQSWAASWRGKAVSPVGDGLWEETMRWRGRSQLPLWDMHKAAIRERRQHVCPAWEVSFCHGRRVVQGLGQKPTACSVPLHTAPLRLAPLTGAGAPRADTGSTGGQGTGALPASAGTRCLRCFVLALQWHSHTRPPSLGQLSSPGCPAQPPPAS